MNIFERRIKPRGGVEFHGRVSADKDDRGYQNLLNLGGPGPSIRIMLDGVEQPHSVMADPIEGVVRRCKLNSRGEIYAIGDEVAEETLYGRVQVLINK